MCCVADIVVDVSHETIAVRERLALLVIVAVSDCDLASMVTVSVVETVLSLEAVSDSERCVIAIVVEGVTLALRDSASESDMRLELLREMDSVTDKLAVLVPVKEVVKKWDSVSKVTESSNDLENIDLDNVHEVVALREFEPEPSDDDRSVVGDTVDDFASVGVFLVSDGVREGEKLAEPECWAERVGVDVRSRDAVASVGDEVLVNVAWALNVGVSDCGAEGVIDVEIDMERVRVVSTDRDTDLLAAAEKVPTVELELREAVSTALVDDDPLL